MILLILLQTAAAQAPDIELNLSLRAKSVKIERKGEARLEVQGEGPGNRVDVRVDAQGRTELRNVTVDVHAEASVQEGVKIDAQPETGTPQ